MGDWVTRDMSDIQYPFAVEIPNFAARSPIQNITPVLENFKSLALTQDPRSPSQSKKRTPIMVPSIHDNEFNGSSENPFWLHKDSFPLHSNSKESMDEEAGNARVNGDRRSAVIQSAEKLAAMPRRTTRNRREEDYGKKHSSRRNLFPTPEK